MIKAIFFDWYGTLARFEPPAERVQAMACKAVGVEVSEDRLCRGIALADNFYWEENIVKPVTERTEDEKKQLWGRYEAVVLSSAGVKPTAELIGRILLKTREISDYSKFALFEEVIPTLSTLKKRGYATGMISNIQRDVDAMLNGLGLDSYLDFHVTSREANADKPRPEIFNLALKKAGVSSSEAVHVGDQYKVDVAGARGVGIKPVLLDRTRTYNDVSDCDKIYLLSDLLRYFP